MRTAIVINRLEEYAYAHKDALNTLSESARPSVEIILYDQKKDESGQPCHESMSTVTHSGTFWAAQRARAELIIFQAIDEPDPAGFLEDAIRIMLDTGDRMFTKAEREDRKAAVKRLQEAVAVAMPLSKQTLRDKKLSAWQAYMSCSDPDVRAKYALQYIEIAEQLDEMS